MAEDYNDKTNDELREELDDRDLTTSGNKDELVARLEDDDSDDSNDDTDERQDASEVAEGDAVVEVTDEVAPFDSPEDDPSSTSNLNDPNIAEWDPDHWTPNNPPPKAVVQPSMD